jgi:hypothetical protein
MPASGRENRNATGIENPTPGPVQGDERSSTPGMTGIRCIATSGRIIATLPEIGAVGHKQPYS